VPIALFTGITLGMALSLALKYCQNRNIGK
jgi:hypothetical protein